MSQAQPQSRSKYQIAASPADTRSHRLAYWRDKASSQVPFPDGTVCTPLEKFTEVLDTILDRKWVYATGDGGDRKIRAVRAKMQGYFMWKFVLSADVVFLELVLRLGGEAYSRETWRGLYFPAVIPQLMAINRDPLILPFLVGPDNWPCTLGIDEDVLNRCVALMGVGQQ